MPSMIDRAHLAATARAAIAAALGGRRHPVHVAVRAVGEETLEPRFRLGDGVGPRHADDVEAVRARLLDQRGFDRGGIVQKSRSA